MTTLITGSSLLGSNVAYQLLSQNEKVIIYDQNPQPEHIGRIVRESSLVKIKKGDVLNFPELLFTVKEEGVKRIIHTAALQTHATGPQQPYTVFKVNLEGTLNLLEICRIMDIENFVFFSSSGVYTGLTRDSGNETIGEDVLMKYISNRPTSYYSITKLSAEYFGLCYNQYYGTNFVALRFAAAFGPWTGPHGGFVGGLIDKWVRASLLGQNVSSIDLPFRAIQLIYAKDAAKASVLASRKNRLENRVLNIGMKDQCTFEQIANAIKTIVNKGSIQFSYREKAWSFLTPPFDVSLAEKELGFTPEFDLTAGIEDYVRFVGGTV